RRLDLGRGRGKGVIGRRRRQHDEIDLGGRDGAILERAARGAERQIGRALAFGRDVPLADSRALDDPRVGRIDAPCELVVADDAFRQMRPAADDPRMEEHHPAATCGFWSWLALKRPNSSLMRSLKPPAARSIATSMALAKPSASVLPWLLTAMPFKPRNMAPL